MNSLGLRDSLGKNVKDANTPPIDSGVDSGLSYRSQNSNNSMHSHCSDSASCNSTQCAQASVYTDESSLRNIRDSEFEDSGRDSTTSSTAKHSSHSRNSSRRSSDTGFSANFELEIPSYYAQFSHVIQMKNSFFQPDIELMIIDNETAETVDHICEHQPEHHIYFDDTTGIHVYNQSNQTDGTSIEQSCEIHTQLHSSMAKLKKIEKAEKEIEKRRQKRILEQLRLDKLKIKQILGKGGYAHVQLVECPKGKQYALKCINKNSVVQAGQRRHVKAEREILMEVDSKFILKLYKTFRDDKYVYLLTEVLLGGELFTLMKRNGPLEEDKAKFAVACVVEAIGYLHDRNTVHRDVKPENMLVDTEGYVKLADFGFAKKLGPDGRTRTFCGTPGYLAPELVLKRPHGYAADYWSIGVFLFELLSCKSPFRRTSDAATYKMTLRGIDCVQFPEMIGKQASELIRALCSPEAETRLGSEFGVDELKEAAWLRKFDFDALKAGTMISPLKPEFYGKVDTSQFDNFSVATIESSPPDEISGWDHEF